MTDDQIKHMVDRFLSWKLPENFNPDAGITFKAEFNEHTAFPMKHEPIGTNLFDATEAEAMVRHIIAGMLSPPPSAEPVAWRVTCGSGWSFHTDRADAELTFQSHRSAAIQPLYLASPILNGSGVAAVPEGRQEDRSSVAGVPCAQTRTPTPSDLDLEALEKLARSAMGRPDPGSPAYAVMREASDELVAAMTPAIVLKLIAMAKSAPAPSHTDLMVTPESIGPWLAKNEGASAICDFMGWPEDGPAWDDAHKLYARLRSAPAIGVEEIEAMAKIIDPRLASEEWRKNYASYVHEVEAQALAKAHQIVRLIQGKS